ncbi:MAG: hypothetical protein ACLQEQ_08645 [Nitrososphaerales archaeon]
MSDADVVAKVGDLMRTLDDVKRYTALAYAMVDFVAIIVVSVIAVIALTMLQFVSDVMFGSPISINGQALLLFGPSFPASPWLLLGEGIILASGLIFGILWVDRRVRLTRVGEWKGTLGEGAPGAIKLLSGIDWDSLLGTVSLARVSYLFYALIKVVGYFLLTTVLLSFVFLVPGLLVPVGWNNYVPFISLAIVLLLTRKSLADGFRKLRSLDSLFWDLRWFASEFKRAEFSQA